MKNKRPVILYHAYGVTEIYQQVLFSVLTLFYHLKGDLAELKVVIYTDRPAFFEKYAAAMPLALEYLSPEAIKAYKGDYNFVHRVKICVLQACFTKYDTDILYVDSDTYFTTSPLALLERINPETSIMNSDDYDLMSADELFENSDWLHIRRAIREKPYKVDNSLVDIPLTTRMWNAGVIGMSWEHKALLDQVLDLTDQIYAHRHVFTAEQFAFSYYLQNKTSLISSGDVIFHYWPDFETRYWKRTYNHHFRIFFQQHAQKPVAEQASLAFALSQQHVHLQLPPKTLTGRIIKRLKLIKEVALTGKLQNPD